MTVSALYDGTIRHRHHTVRPTEFTHPLMLAYLDLDELPGLLDGLLVRRRPGLVRFRRSDYLPSPIAELGPAVRSLVQQRTGRRPDGPVRLLANLRTLGHCFNPISLYYCHDGAGALQALVGEVTNTPWGERHAYVLPAHDGSAAVDAAAPKRMHVSPFQPMEQAYRIRAAVPGPTLSVHIENVEDGERVFDATLSMRRRPLTRRTLAEWVTRHPAPSLRALALIYGHAIGLCLRGVPTHPHPRHA